MAENTFNKQDAFFEEFGAILAARHRDNYGQPARDFARYLRATRSNAGLSRVELASRSGLTEAEIVALEHAIIPSHKIEPESLHALAAALDKDIEDFALILEREIPRPVSASNPEELSDRWQNWLASYGHRWKSVFSAALMPLVLVCSAALILLTLGQLGGLDPVSDFIQAIGAGLGSWWVVLLAILLTSLAFWKGHLVSKMTTSSVTNALVGLVVVVVISGVISGLALSGQDLLNPRTSAAEQRSMDVETAHKAQLNRLEEQKIAAENELEIAYARRKQELSLKLLLLREYVLTAAGAISLVIVAIGVAILLTRLGYNRSDPTQQTEPLSVGQSEDVWQSPAYRQARIQAARANERYLREEFAKAFPEAFSSQQAKRHQPASAVQDHPETDSSKQRRGSFWAAA
jgi:transcriptional regulator with XRE-family HTH domain